MTSPGRAFIRGSLNLLRRYLVGPQQDWSFAPPLPDWEPPRLERTSLYLHVPFCRNSCPYCPYTKVTYEEQLVEPYARAAVAEVNWWADRVGPAEITSIYIGGGTPTVAMGAVAQVLEAVHGRFRFAGDICIETNPTDVSSRLVEELHDVGVTLVSVGVQSFRTESLAVLGRRYPPEVAERALSMLTGAGFASVNADIMFALPGQSNDDVVADLARAIELGADQVTTYPLFTFPYTAVGEHMKLEDVRMPNLRARRRQYGAIHDWCRQNGLNRVSVWGYKRGAVPRYSSVTRDGYIGIGPGAGSQFEHGFALNTFDLESWGAAVGNGRSRVALYMPFHDNMAGWWWLYWRLYDTRIPLGELDRVLGNDVAKARRFLALAERAGFAIRKGDTLELTKAGAFWLHLAQNYLALDYVNRLWTAGQSEPWPERVGL